MCFVIYAQDVEKAKVRLEETSFVTNQTNVWK